MTATDWLVALRDPQAAADWDLADWERVVRLSRRLRLLGRLAESVLGAGLADRVPPQAMRHLVAERRYSRWRTAGLEWAIERVGSALVDVPWPLVLLKGAAYVGQELPIAAGRLPSDVDLLVPREHLAATQARLVDAGWSEAPLDEHDRRYYHQWSHEVPPMRHPLHGLELDLHHNVVPPLAGNRVDAAALLSRLQPSRWPRWQVLHPHDQVLHCAAHLVDDADLRDRVRDLVDLDGLLRRFGAEPGFWDGLPARAGELGLGEVLALACACAMRRLGTPIPADARARIDAAGPSPLRRRALLALLTRALDPAGPDGHPPRSQEAALNLLALRYHWRRLPPRRLIPHLAHKLRTRWSTSPGATPAGDPLR